MEKRGEVKSFVGKFGVHLFPAEAEMGSNF